MKARICFFVMSFIILFSNTAIAENKISGDIDAKSYILLEQSTGRVLSEMNADEKLPIASVTKIMTMLLIMDAIDDGVIKYDDLVTVSENAMSYGGSTMFLEAGEQLSVNDMLKGIAVASANDGCVAMAEHLAGSESAFVDKMNEKAKELGMTNTNFMNTNGLDQEGHYSSARDVGLMSMALLKHPDITKYTTIWMDELRDGKFQLANTNKLIRFYNGANGLKTGSTSQALCCLSASAKRDNLQLIAVILGAPTSEKRFSSARTLLDYGFANYKMTELIKKDENVCMLDVKNGEERTINALAKENKSLLSEKSNKDKIERRVFTDELTAPVKQGDTIGYIEFVSNEKTIEKVDLIAEKDIAKKSFGNVVKDIVVSFM